MEPTEAEKTLIDSANSLIDLEVVKKSKKARKGVKDAEQPTEEIKANGDATEEIAKELEPEDKEKKVEPAVKAPEAVEIAAN